MSTEVSWNTGEDFSASSSDFLEAEGWFHFVITWATNEPKKHDGSPLLDTFIQMKAEVLAGSVPGQERKTLRFDLKQPMPSNQDGGKFRREKIDRFLYAVGLVSPDAKNSAIKFNLESLTGCQFVAKTKLSPMRDGKGQWCDINGKMVYHVDDAEVADRVSLNQDAIKLLPPARRLISGKPAVPPPPPPANPGASFDAP